MTRGRFLAASVLVLLATSFCPAAAFEWADPASGSFDAPGNWNLLSGAGTFPVAGDTAIFNETGTYQVQFDAAAESGRIDFQAGDVTFHGAAPGQTYTLTGGSQDAVVSGGTLTLGATGEPLDVLIGDDLDLQLDAVLRVTSGSLLDVGSNVQVGLGNGTSSEIVVDGPGSRIDVAAGVILGATGATGTLTLQNDSTGNVISGNLNIATHLGDNVAGRLAVRSDSTLQTDSIFMAAPLLVGGPNLTAELTVVGTDSALTMTGASTLSIGKPGAAYSALVIIDSGGELNTGTGLISIGDGGRLYIGDGGSAFSHDGVFNANGPVVMSSSALLWLNGGRIVAAAGLDNSAGGTLDFSDGTLEVTGEGSSFDPGGGIFTIDGDVPSDLPTLRISDQATAEFETQLRIGDVKLGNLVIESGGMIMTGLSGYVGFDAGSTGTATVTGSGSSGSEWNISVELFLGYSGTGTLNVEDGGVVSGMQGAIGFFSGSVGTATVTGGGQWNTSNDLSVGFSGKGTLNVEDGGVVSNRRGTIGVETGSTGTATVTGSGSQWNNSTDLSVGGLTTSSGGKGTLNIENDGLVSVNGTLKIGVQGTVTIDGGHVVTGTFDNSTGGSFNWIAGSLTINSGVEVGSGAAFPVNLTLSTHQNLITPATTTIAANRTLVLDGGQLTTNNLEVDGSLQFNGGTLELTGGTVTGLTQIVVPSGGTLRSNGVLNLPVSAAAGSQIVATGDLTLGDAGQAAGFYSNGNVNVADHTLTVDDANDAVFDSGANVRLGDGGNPGAIAAAGGLTLDFGGNIAGHGTVDTPDSPASPLVNNGHVTGNSGAEPITLTGYVKGVGTLDNVVITGTDAPGFSPATVVRGSVAYEGALEIEIGGTASGDFDQINHILGGGLADLGGQLNVALINGFLPSLEDSFEIITATGGVSGTFATLAEELPVLVGGLEWAIDYGANNVVLSVVAAGLPGDYNGDGTVDAADYTVWRDHLGTDFDLGGNGDENGASAGVVDQADYLYWTANFGATLGSGGAGAAAQAAVPEPSTLVLASLCFLGILYFRNAR